MFKVRVWGSGFRAEGSGVGFGRLALLVQDLGLGAKLWFRIWVLGLRELQRNLGFWGYGVYQFCRLYL